MLQNAWKKSMQNSRRAEICLRGEDSHHEICGESLWRLLNKLYIVYLYLIFLGIAYIMEIYFNKKGC